MDKHLLYYGDNLDILRRYLDDDSVDLIYLDPPFNSQQAYNIIFAEDNGSGSSGCSKTPAASTCTATRPPATTSRSC